ncbi:MAG: hypothetical protein OXC37_04945 [Bdellovibrionaceae bacterium]|nr:hypothetical protein [Pseudobdellovibrionaceae bacterium]
MKFIFILFAILPLLSAKAQETNSEDSNLSIECQRLLTIAEEAKTTYDEILAGFVVWLKYEIENPQDAGTSIVKSQKKDCIYNKSKIHPHFCVTFSTTAENISHYIIDSGYIITGARRDYEKARYDFKSNFCGKKLPSLEKKISLQRSSNKIDKFK